MHRLGNGQPIRDAMVEGGWTILRLAARTKEVDPAGYGVSSATIGNMVAPGKSGRTGHQRRSAELAAKALGKPLNNLFSDAPTT